jgi:nicotinamidase-related amidase
MLMDADDSQLVLIDYQERLMPAVWEGQACLDNAMRLAQAAHLLGVPVWGTEQNPSKLGIMPSAMKALCTQTLAKMQFSACEEGLIELLRPAASAQTASRQCPQLAQAFAKTRVSPSQAAARWCWPVSRRMCVCCKPHWTCWKTRFEVWVVTDACSSRTERNRDAAFDRLAGAGIELVTTEMVLFEWLQTAEHPHFKDDPSLDQIRRMTHKGES